MPSDPSRPVDREQLITDNEDRLYRAALAILGSREEAEDAVQSAYVTFLEKAPDDLKDPGAWLMRVLVNSCKSQLRRPWRKHVPLLDTIPAPEPEERQEVEEIFSLSPAERTAIHLFYYEGYSTDEIARITGQRAGTVRSRLSRARQKLRKLMTDG